MTRPSHVDSQRIISLLDETNHRLEVLAWLTEENLDEVFNKQEDFSKVLDPRLVKYLINHLNLLREFNTFNPENENRVIDLGEKTEGISDKAYEIADLLEKNTIEVTRWLSNDRDSFTYLCQLINVGTSGVPSFLDVAKELKKLYLTKLITPVEEELSRERETEEIDAKLKKAKAEEAENNERLENLKRQRDEGRENRTKELRKLRQEQQNNDLEISSKIREIQKETERAIRKLGSEYDPKIRELKDKKDLLDENLAKFREEEKKKEEDPIKDKQRQQMNKLEVTIKEYDKDMIENAMQLERETKAYNENKEILEALEMNIRQIRTEKERIEEENKREAIKAKNYESLQSQKEIASAYISAHWKGLKTRQEYEKLKKSKKKRGKKGK